MTCFSTSLILNMCFMIQYYLIKRVFLFNVFQTRSEKQSSSQPYRACKSRAPKRGGGAVGAGNPYSPCEHIGLRFVFVCDNRTVPKQRVSVIQSEGLLQAEAMEHIAGDNDHGNHEFVIDYYGGCHGISVKYLCLAILTNNEECHFSRSPTCLGQTYTCVMIMCISTSCQI